MSTSVTSRSENLNICNLLTQEQEKVKLEGGVAETAMKKAAESVVKWYPPLVLERNPGLAGAVELLFPPLGRVLEWSRQIFRTIKALFRCR